MVSVSYIIIFWWYCKKGYDENIIYYLSVPYHCCFDIIFEIENNDILFMIFFSFLEVNIWIGFSIQ